MALAVPGDATRPSMRVSGLVLPPPADEERELVSRAEARRLALQGDQQLLRQRYEEIMRWINPPWDPVTRRLDPRAEGATADRLGTNILHIDEVNPTVDRWAVLELGTPHVFRVKPEWVRPPHPNPDHPEQEQTDRKSYELDRAIAQAQATQMENQTEEWRAAAALDRTLLWAGWCKEAFGKGIVKTGWDPDDGLPTAELYENPSTVYYGWSKRYGNRKLAWALVTDELDVSEANARYGVDLPLDQYGGLHMSSWTGALDQGDLDQRPEQQQEIARYVNAVEYWELAAEPESRRPIDPATGQPDPLWTPRRTGVRFCLIIAGRVVDGPVWYPWKKLPFHVLENQHIPTWSHGKSVAEVAIPINAALDDMLDRQHQVIEFESGPRFKGLNMFNSGDEVDVPPPFHLVPLREGEDIAQIDARVDFFPSELHAGQLADGQYKSTGLTPIAWGMSPNAQTSGRAMSAEWRAVELPLTGKIVNMTPDIRAIYECWWDYAEEYQKSAKEVARGYRRFEVSWLPFDIRDKTEKTADIINRLGANLIDPETAIEESGYNNVDEIKARIESYLMNPVWNPLRVQQFLTLQQLELQIRQQALEVQQMEAAAQQQGPDAGGGAPGAGAPSATGDLTQQGEVAAVQGAQGGAPGSEATNQPGQMPGSSGIPVETGILLQTPLGDGGIGNRAMVSPGGPSPANGQTPR